MVYRDPNTGQFVSDNDSHGQYNDIESWTFNSVFRFDAEEDNDFTERFATILDIDQITDRRREAAHLLHAEISTACVFRDGFVDDGGYYLQFQTGRTDLEPILTTSQTSRAGGTDSLDAIGEPLVAHGEHDRETYTWDMDTLADPVFHPRNEINLAGELFNAEDEDGDVIVTVSGQMVFGLKDAEGSGR